MFARRCSLLAARFRPDFTMSISVLANHAHVFPAALNPAGTIDRLLQLLDGCDIDGAVCFAPFPTDDVPGSAHNRWLAGELKNRPRLHGFGTIDFKRNDVRDQVKEAADLGFRGLKLHPNSQQFDVLGPWPLEAYAAAEELGLLITFHSGVHHYRIEHYNVLKFDEVAWRFPKLRFTLEHVGGYSFFEEALAVIFNNIPFPPIPGRKGYVFGGLTSIFTPNYNRFWYMPRQRMEEMIAQVGAAQLIFGLDFPYNLEQNTKLALNTINELPINEKDRALILGGNLRAELGLE
jgi:predicted TIM-barrel fold metal-dependent hydrolase